MPTYGLWSVSAFSLCYLTGGGLAACVVWRCLATVVGFTSRTVFSFLLNSTHSMHGYLCQHTALVCFMLFYYAVGVLMWMSI
mgnify:CR=1 FL=1